jgi:ABC-2 type transport system permease protein
MTEGFVRSLRAIRARAYIRIVGANREISWLVTEIALPILSVAAYILLYRSLGLPPIYEGLVIVGGAMIPLWMVVLWSMAMQLFWEKGVGNLDIYLSSPTDPIMLLIGMAIGGMFMAGLRSAMILLLGILIFHVDLFVSDWFLFITVLTLTMTALFSMGMAAASVYFVTGRMGIKINIALMEPIYMMSGLYFPMKNMGAVMGIVASLIPLSLGLDGIRQLCLPGGASLKFISVHAEIGILFAMSVVFGIASYYLLRRMERKGRIDGTLSERWM